MCFPAQWKQFIDYFRIYDGNATKTRSKAVESSFSEKLQCISKRDYAEKRAILCEGDNSSVMSLRDAQHVKQFKLKAESFKVIASFYGTFMK